MCECQGNPLARVTLALGLPYLLANRALITETHYFLTESRCCRGRLNHALNTTVRQPLKKPLYSLRLYTQEQLCSCPSLDEFLSGFDGIFRVANFGHEICTDKR